MTPRLPSALLLGLAAAVALVAAEGAPAAGAAVHVRANAAFAVCLAPALDSFDRVSGTRTVLDVGDVDPVEDADLVVGDDTELGRLLESGTADLASAFDLGVLPWVTVVPAGSPAGALSGSPITVLGGRVGREARLSLSAGRDVQVSRDPLALRRARYALVPRSLAGPGQQRPAAVRPLMATAAVIASSPRIAQARRILDFLRGGTARRALAGCLDAPPSSAPSPSAAPGAHAASSGAVSYAQRVVDWWLPQCTLDRNGYTDPQAVIGAPDAIFFGTADAYSGIMSLGQGGYVTVEMSATAFDGPGADIRVIQATAGEPVTVYASTGAQGPFVLIGLQQFCGDRTEGLANFQHHCDFDLRSGGLAEARYLKIEDGEIYPCLAAGTRTEGADIDAIVLLNGR